MTAALPIEAGHPSPILTAAEAAQWLRLVDEDAPPDAQASGVKSVQRLVQLGQLRPLRPGRSYCFLLAELERFAAAAVMAWPGRPGMLEGSEARS